jgi:hypothetical protein
VDVHTHAATVDLARAQMHQVQRGVGDPHRGRRGFKLLEGLERARNAWAYPARARRRGTARSACGGLTMRFRVSPSEA